MDVDDWTELQPPLHPLEGRGRAKRQDVAAVRNPR